MPDMRFRTHLWELTPTPDGQGVLVYGPTRVVHHHALDGRRLRTFGSEGDEALIYRRVAKVAFHPDGKRLLIACGRLLRVWDWESGALLHTVEAHGDARGLVFFAGGKYAVAHHGEHNGAFTVLNLEKESKAIKVRANGLSHMVMNPAGDTLYTSGGGIWKLERARPQLKAVLDGKQAETECLAVSADGQHVAMGDELGVLQRFAAAGGKPLRTYKGNQRQMRNLAFLSDGRLVSAGGLDRRLRLWSPTQDAPLLEVNEVSNGLPGALAISPDERHAAFAGFREAQLIDLQRGQVVHRWPVPMDTTLAYVGQQLMAASDLSYQLEPADVKVQPLNVD